MLRVLSAYCDTCSKTCKGSRYTCIDCLDNVTPEASLENSLDFCSLECSEVTILPNPTTLKKSHNPSHDVLKKRTCLPVRDVPVAYRKAKAAISACRGQFSHVSEQRRNDFEEAGSSTEAVLQATGADLSKGAAIVHLVCSLQCTKSMYGFSSDNTKPPQCKICHKAVTMPCWFCIDCAKQGRAIHRFCSFTLTHVSSRRNWFQFPLRQL